VEGSLAVYSDQRGDAETLFEKSRDRDQILGAPHRDQNFSSTFSATRTARSTTSLPSFPRWAILATSSLAISSSCRLGSSSRNGADLPGRALPCTSRPYTTSLLAKYKLGASAPNTAWSAHPVLQVAHTIHEQTAASVSPKLVVMFSCFGSKNRGRWPRWSS